MSRFIVCTGLLLFALTALWPAVLCQTQPAASQSDSEPTEITRLQAQAGKLLREGKYDEALQLASQTLKLAEQAPTNDTMTADSLFLVGRLYRLKGDYGKAMTFSERALAIREKTLEANHPKLVDSLNEMGILLDRKGEYAKGIEYLQRALPIYEKAFGPDRRVSRSKLKLVRDQSAARCMLNWVLFGTVYDPNPGLERVDVSVCREPCGQEAPTFTYSIYSLSEKESCRIFIREGREDTLRKTRNSFFAIR